MTEPARTLPKVIRLLQGGGENSRDRLLKKLVPSWVISGAVHVLILAVLILGFRGGQPDEQPPMDVLQAAVEQYQDEERQKDLTNPDLGLDDSLRAIIPDAKLDEITVDNKIVPDEPPGVSAAESAIPLDVPRLAGIGEGENLGVLGTEGAFKAGDAGLGGSFFAPGFRGRNAATREKMALEGGGNAESEAAVARGLIWLARQQRDNGSWVFDGSSANDTCAATAMAMLPFLAAGQTHKEFKGNTYRTVVARGLDQLLSQQNPDNGSFRTASNIYSHSIATIALCELYGMTGDKQRVLPAARKAVDYLVKAQGANGSWGYRAGTEGDTSIVGWAIQALKSAELCRDIPFPRTTLDKARKFLDEVSGGSKMSTYGYREGPGRPGTALTAVGLLCRYYMDGWGPVHPGMQEGVAGLISVYPPDPARFNIYYYYYATQVIHFHGGDEWTKVWNPKMRDMLIELQVKQDNPRNAGSWARDRSLLGSSAGRLGTTCLALLTLEVYYRHLPLYKRDTGGMVELERVK